MAAMIDPKFTILVRLLTSLASLNSHLEAAMTNSET
jgi:hypothetical protein